MPDATRTAQPARQMMRCGLALVAAAMAIAAAGCIVRDKATIQAPTEESAHRGASASELTAEDVHGILNDFGENFTSTIKQAAMDLDQQDASHQRRRLTLIWRIRILRALSVAQNRENPITSFLDTWLLCERHEDYFAIGAGKTLFGENQAIAAEAAAGLARDIEQLAKAYMRPTHYEAAQEFIEQFAAEHPIRGTFSETVLSLPTRREAALPDNVMAVINLPLAPFRAFQGVNRTSVAVADFTHTADRFTHIVQALPETTRWQLDLLMMDLERNEIVTEALSSAAELALSSRSLADLAPKLPELIGDQLVRLLDALEAKQASLERVLTQANETAQKVGATMDKVDATAQAIDQTAHSVAETGQAWESAAKAIGDVVREIRENRQPTSQPPPPFDINDYRATAEALTASARELQTLVRDVRDLLLSDDVAARLDDVDTRVQGNAKAITDRAFIRAIVLLVVAFVLALIYRAIAVRMGRDASKTAGT